MTIEELIEAKIVTDRTHITVMELGKDKDRLQQVMSGYWFNDHILGSLRKELLVFAWHKETGLVATLEV